MTARPTDPDTPFHKSRPDAPTGFFEREAAGLRWLTVPDGPRVVRVLATNPEFLDLENVTESAPDAEGAYYLGSGLAVMHDAGADAFGVPPAATSGHGFFGPLNDPLSMVTGRWDSWPQFYGEARLRPIAAQGLDRGALTRADVDALHRTADDVARIGGTPCCHAVPARVHGDLWAGNVLWSRSARDHTEAVLIDPAAHGGHRESDLAMLALFGAPHLDAIMAGYTEKSPIPPGWERRRTLHQLYPVAVHAVLFGGGYRAQMRSMIDVLTA